MTGWPDEKEDERETHCALCARRFYSDDGRFPVGHPTVHHLVPKHKYHGKLADAETVLLCTRCHKQIHRLFDNRTLKRQYSDLVSLRAAPGVPKFVAWLRKE